MTDLNAIGCTTRPYGGLTYQEAFHRIAVAGYRDVAVFSSRDGMPVDADSTPAQVGAVRRAAADNGLRPSLLIGGTRLDLGLTAAVETYTRLIHNAGDLGVKFLLDCGVGDPAHFDDYFELMRQCAPRAEAVGLELTMKPHGGISLTIEDLLRAHQHVAHPAFGICFDPGNIIYYTLGEHRPEPDAPRAVPVCNTFIVKDCVVRDGTPDVMVTAGDGLVDFPQVIRPFVSGGFAGPYYVECVGGTEPAAIDRDIAFTLGYVRGILQAHQCSSAPTD